MNTYLKPNDKTTGMRILTIMLCLLASVACMADNAVKQDSIVHPQPVEAKTALLDAASADKPRQIPIGLPAALASTIFEDGLPVSSNIWPVLPFLSWGGDVGQTNRVMTLSESALKYGLMGNIVDAHNKYSPIKLSCAARLNANIYGRVLFSGYISSPLGRGVSIAFTHHMVSDPGANRQLTPFSMLDKLSLHYDSPDKRLHMKLQGLRSSNHFLDINYAPFIFVGDGSIKRLNSFRPGLDSYYPTDGKTLRYIDPETGQEKEKGWKDLSTTRIYQLQYNMEYRLSEYCNISLASKFKSSGFNHFTLSASGVVKNDNSFTYQDRTAYVGEYVQNRFFVYTYGKTNDWLTTLELNGNSRNKKHKWLGGALFWYSKTNLNAATAVMSHEACAKPRLLYMTDSDGNSTPYRSANTSGEYYDGNEIKAGIYVSDEWQIHKRLWLSAGLRLTYSGYRGHAANNVTDAEGNTLTNNTRVSGWYLNMPGVTRNRIKADDFEPSATFLFRYKLLDGFGLNGEAIFVRKHKQLESYAGANYPYTKPSDYNMARAGIYWNNSWIQLVSQFFYVNRSNNFLRNMMFWEVEGKEESQVVPLVYNVQTMGWNTDILLTPFKGFQFHGLLTLQNPVYKDYLLNAHFSDGEHSLDISNNVMSGMERILIEMEPSYTYKKWRGWVCVRYFGKQYINKSNSLYLNPRWETFAGIDFKLLPSLTFSLNAVNLLGQTGATGSIGAADLVDKEHASKYVNWAMAGSYIRPFELSLGVTWKL